MATPEFTIISREDYLDTEKDRITSDQLADDQLYTFNALLVGNAQAVSGIVSLENIDRRPERTLFRLCLKDQDLQTGLTLESQLEGDYWRPGPERLTFAGRTALIGYFISHNDGLDRDFLEQFAVDFNKIPQLV